MALIMQHTTGGLHSPEFGFLRQTTDSFAVVGDVEVRLQWTNWQSTRSSRKKVDWDALRQGPGRMSAPRSADVRGQGNGCRGPSHCSRREYEHGMWGAVRAQRHVENHDLCSGTVHRSQWRQSGRPAFATPIVRGPDSGPASTASARGRSTPQKSMPVLLLRHWRPCGGLRPWTFGVAGAAIGRRAVSLVVA